MKNNSTLAGLLSLYLLVLTSSLQAAITNDITVRIAPPDSGGTVTGAGHYTNGSSVTLTASTTNDCYVFENWTVGGKTITTNPYIFTVAKTEEMTANFAQLEYTIYTSSSPTNWGTTTGGGKKGCGTPATLRATAKAGFAFTAWTSTRGSPTTNNPYKITVTDDEYLVAHFKDVAKPTIMITNVATGDKVGTAAFAIVGTAKDNVAVAAVYYNLNGAGWVLASNADNFAFWYALVTLTPNSTNTVAAYAVDTSGNFSKTTNTVKFVCTAAGLAPLSIAGQLVVLDEGTNFFDTNYVSFDSAVYVRWAEYTNSGSEVGTYTYTPTGPDTAELVPHRVLPTQDTGTNGSVLELTFTDAYDATFTNLSGGGGTLSFYSTEESVPTMLDGVVAVATSYNGSYVSTNSFASASFIAEDNLGGSTSGTYTFTPFTLVDALLVQTYTDPTTKIGTTNYQIMMFSEGTSPASGYYSSEVLGAAGAVVSLDSGTFTTTSNKVTSTFWGPATLAGLQATITPKGEDSFTRSYGKGTFASTSLVTNEPTDVGIILANTHVAMKTGISTLMALAPPYALRQDDETVDVTWKNIAGTSATLSDVVSGKTSSVTYLKAKNDAPAALAGWTVKATQTEGGKLTTITFTNNMFISKGAINSSGSYTYAPYTPTMALVEFTTSAASNAEPSLYIHLNYESPASGAYVSAEPNLSSEGNWKFSTGVFSMTK